MRHCDSWTSGAKGSTPIKYRVERRASAQREFKITWDGAASRCEQVYGAVISAMAHRDPGHA
ncbi:MAG: hypothetical protein L0Y44_01600 [Phycisphaerales bacterium]|nr:hypothetical protein [Phycisphaerales bacterium]